MSFGWSGSDVFLLVQLAWKIIENTRKACGEYKELARETLRLHAVLQRLEQEVAKPESPSNNLSASPVTAKMFSRSWTILSQSTHPWVRGKGVFVRLGRRCVLGIVIGGPRASEIYVGTIYI